MVENTLQLLQSSAKYIVIIQRQREKSQVLKAVNFFSQEKMRIDALFFNEKCLEITFHHFIITIFFFCQIPISKSFPK